MASLTITPPLFDLTVRVGCSLAYEVTGEASLLLHVKPQPNRNHAVVFEALTLVQTEKVRPFPIVLIGRAYWSGLLDWIRETMLGHGCIYASDLDLLQVVDDAEAAAAIIFEHYERVLGAPVGELHKPA